MDLTRPWSTPIYFEVVASTQRRGACDFAGMSMLQIANDERNKNTEHIMYMFICDVLNSLVNYCFFSFQMSGLNTISYQVFTRNYEYEFAFFIFCFVILSFLFMGPWKRCCDRDSTVYGGVSIETKLYGVFWTSILT